MRLHPVILVFTLLVVAGLCSCDDDDESAVINFPDYSELGVLGTNSKSQLAWFTNDDDEYFSFDDPYSIDTSSGTNPLEPNSTYRAYVHYKYADDPGEVSFWGADILAVEEPMPQESIEEVKTDPIQDILRIWVSNNGSYINLALSVFATQNNDQQIFHFIDEGTDDDGHAQLLMYHDQVSLTSYDDLSTTYVGIPVESYFSGLETVDITINTYNDSLTTTSVTIPNLRDDVANLQSLSNN